MFLIWAHTPRAKLDQCVFLDLCKLMLKEQNFFYKTTEARCFTCMHSANAFIQSAVHSINTLY